MAANKTIRTIKLKFHNQSTPFLAVNLESIRRKYRTLNQYFPHKGIYYAVKANPAVEVISALRDLGSCFDIASIYELDRVISLGVSPTRISFGNTIKKKKEIAYAFDRGVNLFACDSIEDLKNIAQAAPCSKVFFRLSTDGSGSDWPLSKKFGCHPDRIITLIIAARALKLIPKGISFHVGSQQKDIGQWKSALSTCRYIFNYVKRKKITLDMINLGGGFPCTYIEPINSLQKYCTEILSYVKETFSDIGPEILIEPGRALTGEAGTLVTEVILVTKKDKMDLYKWVYLDAGLFGGLIETLGEAIKYPVYCERIGKTQEVILAGPTCDSVDIMYQNYKYQLPANLRAGDKLYIGSTGAYTASYSSIEFNGFPPLSTVYY